MRGMAVAAFVAIFFLDAPFPLIVLTAALAGFLGGRAGLPAFQVGGGHASMGADVVHDRDTALGEGLPDHARPNLAWSLKISGALLILWLAPEIGRAHVCTPVTNAHLVCSLLLEKKNKQSD